MRCVGLVSRVVPADDLLDESIEAATKIASFSQPIGMYILSSIQTACSQCTLSHSHCQSISMQSRSTAVVALVL